MIGNPFTDHPVGPKGDTGSTAVNIGDPVTGAGSIANAILFGDGSKNLAQSAGLTYNADGFGNFTLSVYAVGATLFIGDSGSDAYAQIDVQGGAAALVLSTDSGKALTVACGATAIDFKIDGGTFFSGDSNGDVTIANLAGTGSGIVTSDANGKLVRADTVGAAIAVASTHKVTIDIGGATYYLLATNIP